MKVKALKTFQSTTYGNIDAGRVYELPEGIARQWAENGMVAAYETKVVVPVPLVPAALPSSASPAGQASMQTISNGLGRGGKRQRKGAGSLS